MTSELPVVGDTIVLEGTTELSIARRSVAHAALDVLAADRTPDVELCVSELVTNALEHGDGTGVVVSHGVVEGSFIVTVSNGSHTLPQRAIGRVPVDRPSGRGLQIVHALADGVAVYGEHGAVAVSCRFDP